MFRQIENIKDLTSKSVKASENEKKNMPRTRMATNVTINNGEDIRFVETDDHKKFINKVFGKDMLDNQKVATLLTSEEKWCCNLRQVAEALTLILDKMVY